MACLCFLVLPHSVAIPTLRVFGDLSVVAMCFVVTLCYL